MNITELIILNELFRNKQHFINSRKGAIAAIEIAEKLGPVYIDASSHQTGRFTLVHITGVDFAKGDEFSAEEQVKIINRIKNHYGLNGGVAQSVKNRLVDFREATLNGKPARIMGRLDQFAVVGDFEGASVEFAWSTVKNIVDNKNGEFKA